MARLQHNRCGDKEWPACYGRSGDDLPRPILIFVAAKENGFACYGRSGDDLPRPILIFVAAKKNGFACYGRSGSDLLSPILPAVNPAQFIGRSTKKRLSTM